MDRNDLRSQSLDLLRFPLAVVVLVIHTFSSDGFTVEGNLVTLENFPVTLEVNRLIDAFLRGQSVPIYFFISGFVFFLGMEPTRERYVRKLKNRVKSLLIPYLIWNAVALARQLILHLPFFAPYLPHWHAARPDFSLPAVLATFWDRSKGILVPTTPAGDTLFRVTATAPADGPLWFVRDLMLVALCTPLLYWLLKRTRHYLVLLLGIAWFALAYGGSGRAGQLLSATFFFSWGAYMSVNKKDMMREFGRFSVASAVLYPLLALLHFLSAHYFPELSAIIKRLTILVGLFFAYNTSSWILSTHRVRKVSPFLASSAFFIYVSHALFCSAFAKLLYLLFRPATDVGMLAIFVSAVVITVSMLLSTFYLLRRYAPRLLNVITGRR